MKTITLLLLTTFFILACDQAKQEKATQLFEQGKELEAMHLPDSAMVLYQRAVDELKNVKNDTLAGVIYNKIGDLMYSNDLYEDAFKPYSKALICNSKLNDKTEASRSLRGMGKSLSLRKLSDSAAVYFNKALLLSSSIHNKEEISLIHNNLSLAYYESGNHDSSFFHNTKALQTSKDSTNIFKNYCIRADLFMQINRYDSASIYYNLGRRSKNLRTQAACVIGLANVAKAINNEDSAKYISIFRILKDSIERNCKTFEILKKDKQYHIEKAEKELDSKYSYLIIAVLVLSLVFIVIFTRRHHYEKRKNQNLSVLAKKLQLEMSKLECELERAVERNEIKKKLMVGSQLLDVQATVIKDMKKLGNKATTNYRKTQSYEKLKELMETGKMREKERNIFHKRILEAFAPFNTYLVTFLDFSTDDCLYCSLCLLKFKTSECALFRNLTEDAIRSQKRRLKNKINEVFASEELYDYIFVKTK